MRATRKVISSASTQYKIHMKENFPKSVSSLIQEKLLISIGNPYLMAHIAFDIFMGIR